MLPYERHERILTAARADRFVKIEDLLRITGSSLSTLRRDINQLAEEGRIRKSRGGVLLEEMAKGVESSLLYLNREKLYKAEKERIGRAAQNFIEDGDFLVLLNGTTTVAVARSLSLDKRVTIITNGIDIVTALRDKPNAQVILLGGLVDYAHYLMTGPMVLRDLGDLHAAKLISGAGGISAEKGVTVYPYMVSAYYGRIVEMVEQVIVVADHSKLGRNALVQVIELDKVDTLITDTGAEAVYLELLERHGISCILG
jgi:DeoR/GlpR family transcriptional regulator of sugar metabolism